jgi:vitamin B12 transporter
MNVAFLITLVIASLLSFSSTSALAEDKDLALFFSDTTMVETVRRHPQPILEVAENLSLVTAAQIKAMNAHTLYEVLNRVPGLYLAFDGGDFGSLVLPRFPFMVRLSLTFTVSWCCSTAYA